jgi:hypothetical protein
VRASAEGGCSVACEGEGENEEGVSGDALRRSFADDMPADATEKHRAAPHTAMIATLRDTPLRSSTGRRLNIFFYPR